MNNSKLKFINFQLMPYNKECKIKTPAGLSQVSACIALLKFNFIVVLVENK